MTTNEAIARWLGFYTKGIIWRRADHSIIGDLPDYEHSDSAAITLLPVLVERGYTWLLLDNPKTKDYSLKIGKTIIFREIIATGTKPTIATAICAAIMELIAKGE